jgi:hypothetical protein
MFARSIAHRLKRRATAEALDAKIICPRARPKNTQRPQTNSKFIIIIVFGYCCGLDCRIYSAPF